MKDRKLLFVVTISQLLFLTVVYSQGTFQNMDFEDGVFIPVASDLVQWGPAMPGWVGYLGTNQQSVISFNNLSLSTPNIAIMGGDNPVGVFHGHYYVVMQTSFPTPSDVPAITQTATIPAGAESIQFITNDRFALGFLIFFGGQRLSISQLGATPSGQWLWGGDISAFGGQTGELRFQGVGYLDYIRFSQAVPEPNALGFFGFGALLLAWRALRKKG